MRHFIIQYLIILGAILCQGSLFAADAGAEANKRPPGKIVIVHVVGENQIISPDEKLTFSARAGALVLPGQMISTGKNATVVLVFSNGTTVNLGAESVLAVDEFLQDPFGQVAKVNEMLAEPSTSNTRLRLVQGELLANVKKLNKTDGSTFTVTTPVGAAGIRGTTFRTSFVTRGNKADFALSMVEGLIELTFKSRGSPAVMIATNQEVVLNDLDYDPATGEVSNIPRVTKPTDVSAANQAALAQWVLQMIAATNTIRFEPTGPATQVDPGASVDDAQPQGPGITRAPAPPALPPLPITSPTDGQAGQ